MQKPTGSMSNEFESVRDLSASGVRDPAAMASGAPGQHNGSAAPAVWRNGAPRSNAAVLWPLLQALFRRWPWLIVGGVTFGLVGFACGFRLWKTSWTAPAQLIRYDSPNAVEVFGMRQAAPATLPSLLHSPELLQRVGTKADPPLAADILGNRLRVMPEHDSEIIVVTITGEDPSATLALVNVYAGEAVRFTQEMQAKAANEIVQFTTEQIAHIDSEINSANREALNLSSGTATAAIAPLTSTVIEKIQAARIDLAVLLAKYTEAHPTVSAKRAELAALQMQLPPRDSIISGTNTDSSAGTGRDVLVSKLQTLESARLTLLGRKQAALALTAKPPGYCQLLAAGSPKDLVKHGRKAKVLMLSAFLGLLGCAGAAAMVLLVEIADDRLKTVADVKRVARLPVLAAAGDFSRMSGAQKDNWAFRVWTSLQGRLSPSPNHGLVCGVTSARPGEGRSTWISLLARIANQQGFRVLTIATRPPTETNSVNGERIENASAGEGSASHSASAKSMALTANILASPGEVAQKLMAPDPEPIVHIPLPGWVWNLERRQQWQEALRHWGQIANVVIFVELPPASQPEAVLLAENLPNVVWLTASGGATAAETCEQLQTLRNARCRLAGAVLNRAPHSIFQTRFRRWIN